MDIVVNRKALAAALAAVRWPGRQTPTVRLEVARRAADLRVSAHGFVAHTDMPVPVLATVGAAKAKGPRLDVTVPIAMLAQAVRSAEVDDVLLRRAQSDEGAWLQVLLGTHELTIRPLATEEHKLGEETRHRALTCSAHTMRQVIARAAPAASEQDARPILTTVHFRRHEDGGAVVRSADGFRLSQQRIVPLAMYGNELALNAQALSRLAKLLPDDGTRIDVWTAGEPLTCDTAPAPHWPTVVWCHKDGGPNMRLVAERGTWPQTDELLATARNDERARAVLDTADLRRAVNVAAAATNVGSPIIRLRLHATRLDLEAIADEEGHYTGRVGANSTPLAGPSVLRDTKVAVNVHYLMDLLRAAHSEEVELTVGGPSSAFLVRAVGDDTWQQLTMPMFVQWGKPATAA